MSMTVFELMATLGLNTVAFEQGLNAAEKSAEGMGGVVGSAFSKTAEAAKVAMAASTAAVGAFGITAVNTGMEFDKSMSNVAAISGAAGSEMDALRDKAQEMGSKTKFSASEAADAMSYMAMAGWKTGDMLSGVEGIMNLAAASGEDLASTSDIVTDALTAFGLSAEDSGHFADVLAAASSNANTNVSMLGESFKYVAPIAGSLGYSAEDTSIALGLMANAGIKASQSGTALRGLLTRLAKPTKESGAAMDRLGISLTDSEGRMKSLSEIMVDMREGFSGLTEEEQAQYAAMLAGQEGMSGLLAIVNAADADFDKLSESIYNSSEGMGVAAQMAEKMQDNLAGDITILSSAWEGFQLAVRDAVDEQNNGLRKIVQFASGSLSDITTAIREGGLIGGLKEVGEIGKTEFGKLTESAKGFYESFKNNTPEIKEFAASLFQKFGSALSDFRNNIGDFTAIGIGILSQISDGIKECFPVFMENWAKNWQAIIGAFSENIDGIVEVGGKIISGLIKGIETALPIVGETIASLFSSIGGYLQENLPTLLEQGLQLIVSFTGTIRENIGPIVDAGLDMILSLAKGITDGLPTLIENIPTIVSNIAGIINDNMPKILETGIQIIVTLGVGLVKAIPALIANIPEILKAIFDVFMAFNWLNLGASVIKAIGTGFKEMATHLPQLLKDIGNKAVEWMKAINWRTLGSDIIDLIKIGIEALVTAIPNALKTIGHTAVEWMKSIDWISLGKNIVLGIIEGIGSAAGWLIDKVVSIGQNALDAVKNFFGISSPSKVMRDQVGKMLAEGIGIGFEGGLPIEGMRETLQDAMDTITDVDTNDILFGAGTDDVSIETIGIESDEKGRNYPADNITINVYAREGQDEKTIAEEVMKLFTLWDNQKKAVYA